MDSPAAIAKWAEGLTGNAKPRPNKDAKPAYKRSNAERIVSILRLSQSGHTQQAIAAELGCSQQCVSQTLAKYGRNTTKDARQILEAKAADMALNIIRNGRPADQVQVLKGFRVIPEDAERQGGLNITINGFALVGLGLAAQTQGEAQPEIVDAQLLSPPLTGDMHSLSAEQATAKGNIKPLISPSESAQYDSQSDSSEADPGAGIAEGPSPAGRG